MAIIKVANTGLDALPSQVEMLDVLTFDGSQSYSLTKDSVAFTPASADSILVSVNGIVQSGENFTVTGSTIDFGESIPGTSVCDFIFQLGTGSLTTPVDNSVSTAKIVDGAVSSAKMFSGFANGITEADLWRLNSTLSSSSSDTVIASNLERADNTTSGLIGTGMSESSGIFSFPQTGIYEVTFLASYFMAGNSRTISSLIQATTNNSSYEYVAKVYHNINQAYSTYYASVMSHAIVDVTDTSNVKVRFLCSSDSSTTLNAHTDYNITYFKFIRLGDN